jgi:hypothetical protein
MSDASLRVTLGLRNRYKARFPVEVRLVVTNVSSEPVLICSRFCPNLPEFPGEIWFRVECSGRQECDFSVLVRPQALKDRDFVVLESGESTETRVDLHHYYAVREPGWYKISGTYRNAQPWSRNGLSAWRGQATSQAVELLVEPS